MKGRLVRREGFVTAAWNAWVAGHPELAGVPVAAVTCYAATEPYSVHEAGDAARRQRQRQDLLAGFRKWSLHDFDQDGGYFSRPLPLFRGDLRDEVANWLEKAGLFAAQAYRLQAAVAQVGERYFDGASTLFPDVAQSLAQDAEIWEHAADLFQQCIAAQFEDAANVSDVPAPRFDLADIRAAGEQQAGELAEYLVDVAKGAHATAVRRPGGGGCPSRPGMPDAPTDGRGTTRWGRPPWSSTYALPTSRASRAVAWARW